MGKFKVGDIIFRKMPNGIYMRREIIDCVIEFGMYECYKFKNQTLIEDTRIVDRIFRLDINAMREKLLKEILDG